MTEKRSTKIIATWIFIGVAMLIVQVLLGGITRLTGSGLSITEWKLIVGALPPLTETQWQKAFEQYQQIAQYKYINHRFTLPDFKFIFFWEWFHRLWARLISIVFLIPFIYFIVKKYLKQWMITPLVILFLLGAAQGTIGWIMVKSGLNDENVYVNHIRLAIHFVSAMVLICYALIFGLKLIIPKNDFVVDARLKKFTIVIIVLILVQLFYGAFMAGLKGAIAAPTWPDINGMIIPKPFFSNNINNDLFFNIINIHFIHRTLAYIIFMLILIWWRKTIKHKTNSFNKTKHLPLVFVSLQIILGIFALLNSPKIVLGHFDLFEWLAQLHQLTGMLLLLSVITNFYLIKSNK
ncbi:MAG TPA: COX15/CtaA family protein [Chitinophagaceae bacterium]|nr:COX15/CtaA family protein [Chitinophagaceae bacterium]